MCSSAGVRGLLARGHGHNALCQAGTNRGLTLVWLPNTPSALKTQRFRAFVRSWWLAEGQLRTTQEDIAEFFQALNVARVVFEVGTHSPWVQEVICGLRTRSAGGQPAINGRLETAQTEE